MDRLIGTAWVVASAVGFGLMALFAKRGHAAGVSTEMLLFLRFASAAVVLGGLALWRRWPLPRGRVLLVLIALGAVGWVGESLCYFSALYFAPIGVVALLFYIYPGIVAVLAHWLLGETLTRRKVSALVLALAGCGLIGAAVAVDPASPVRAAGVGLALLASVIYAFYVIGSARVARHVSPLAAATVVVVSAAVIYGILVLARGAALPSMLAGWWSALGLALCSTAAIIALFAGLERIDAAQAATLSTIEPVVTTLAGVIFLGEGLSGWQAAGGALILSAAVLTARQKTDARSRNDLSTPGSE